MSLDLDTRQRAMLAEMGVQVWWPETPPVELSVDAVRVEPVVATVPLTKTMQAAAPGRPKQGTAPATGISGGPTPDGGSDPHAVGERGGHVATMDWPQLQAAVAGCEACTLCRTRTRTVFGVGPQPGDTPPQVDWLIVGEAPGENEDLQGEPFVGQAGKLLDNMLKAVGLSRHGTAPLKAAYIANVLKCRPPGNRNPSPEEVAQCLPYLQRQVALLQPKIIVAAGRFAVQALLQDTAPDVQAQPLGKLRGRVHRYQGVPVVVTYHPAYLLRALPEKAKAWADLCLALEVLKAP